MFTRKVATRIATFAHKKAVAQYVTKAPKPEIPKNALASVYSAQQQQDCGIVYDRKPFKVTLEAGKTYHWCLCGRSKSQPLCDGTHKDVFLNVTQRYITLVISSQFPAVSIWMLRGRLQFRAINIAQETSAVFDDFWRPIRFQVEKTKDYWLCNCKQTKNRPFCDGTHKQKEIQEASTIKV